MAALEVKGLRETAKNLERLDGDMKTKIGRDSLRAQAWAIIEKVKAATYTTFNKRSGAIQSGFGAAIGHGLKGTMLYGTIVEKRQSIIGSAPTTKLFRQSVLRARQRGGKVDLAQVAFYWRFLEKGTADRRAVRAPRGRRRSPKALERFNAAASLGHIRPRPWVGPTLEATAGLSVEAFRDTMNREIEQTVDGYPK